MQKQKQIRGTSQHRALCDYIGCMPMKSTLFAEYANNYKPQTHSTWAISQGCFQWQTLNTETMFLLWTVQYSYFKILTPNMMVLGYGAFGRSLGHEVGTTMKVCVPCKKRKRASLFPPCENTNKLAVSSLEAGFQQNQTLWRSDLRLAVLEL